MYDAVDRSLLADELADAFLEGQWKQELLAERGSGRLDRWPSWMAALALHVTAAHRSPPVDRPHELVELIETFLARLPGKAEPLRIIRLLDAEHAYGAGGAGEEPRRRRWPVAELESLVELADLLELSDGQLRWLADVRGMERRATDEKLRNYRYAAVRRRSGIPRLIEAPKARLKEIQRWMLSEILEPIPPHGAAHGFTRGRSVISNAVPHLGHEVVLRLDLKDFFASVTAARVYGIYRTAGYAREVAHVLTGLSTNVVPATVWRTIPRGDDPRLIGPHFWLGRQLATPHLPQGAPTSPALANLAAFRLDRRLAGLAGAWGLTYSRYADDLTFSGPRELHRRSAQLRSLVAQIAREERFTLNADKIVFQTAAGRQSICGVVVNVHPNVARREYDQLKAILHNVHRDGPGGQNRTGAADLEAHLRGRIAWVASVNPERGEKLRRRFDKIDWGSRGV